MIDIDQNSCYIFDIQSYSIHDGPGIRTTVFLSGCPLRCLWCQNPESQKLQPQLLYWQEKCSGCGMCVNLCPQNAIRLIDAKVRTDRLLCTACGECAAGCPTEARSIAGRKVTAQEVFRRVAADRIFYVESGGGMTLSGGEALMQPAFATSLAKLCRDAGIHTAVETCGYASWETVAGLLEQIDLVLYDFKHMNSDMHRQCTGVANELILANARRIVHELHKPLLARIPIIPGYNADPENLAATARFIAEELDQSVRVHLLPYHRLGEGKRQNLEQAAVDFTSQPPAAAELSQMQAIFTTYGLETQIGG